MLKTVLLAVEEGAEGGSGLDLILPPIEELVWGAVSFALVVFLLGWKAWPKIRETIERREATIQQALEDSEAARAEAQKMLEDYKRQLGEARSEANRIIEESRQQAEQVRKDVIARAEHDAEQIVERAQEQIEAERRRTMQELQGQLADLSIELAEKVVGRSLDGETQKDLVDAYIREVAGMGGNGRGS